MSTLLSPFCENCGAANDAQTTFCCFCGQPLQDTPGAPATSTTGNLPVDTLLKGRYRIAAPLGRGGMSTVYRAQDTELNNRIVVVKEMRLSGLAEQDAQDASEAFTREATIQANLQHANLPSIFEHFEEHGHWYLVMSFIRGEALDDYLNRSRTGKVPFHEVLQIGKQLCAVLHYLHSQNPPIIFRDVKPANIIRTPHGQVYLIDFGVARRFKPGQKKDTVPFGSVGYAPPEQFGKSQTTPRSDIYSLGATLYQLLSGREPENKSSRFPSLSSLEPTVPTPLADLIAQMLSMDEQQRPADMRVVEQQLQEISNATATAQQAFPFFTQSQPAPKKKLSRLQLALRLTIVAICCLLVGGLGGGLIGALDAANSYQISAHATATAEAIATIPDPYQPGGKLVLLDPLKVAGAWQENADSNGNGQCQFEGRGFQITQTSPGSTYTCDASAIYSNFSMEVAMIIDKGDCGGIELRESDDGSRFYYFEVCANGKYHFFHYTSKSSSDDLIANNRSISIKQGAQTNIIAVVANGSAFDLYVNGQMIDRVNDSSYDKGKIGLVADSHFNETTVTFYNVKIWALP